MNGRGEKLKVWLGVCGVVGLGVFGFVVDDMLVLKGEMGVLYGMGKCVILGMGMNVFWFWIIEYFDIWFC